MTRKLLLEGGAAGHMAHPFDLGWVKTGKDLIKFFTNNVVEYITEHNPTPSVKIDGTNVSFKLVKTPDIEGNIKYEFAVDRGSMQPVDIEGITVDRTGEKWPDPEHGMRSAIEELLPIFNAALDAGIINEEIKILGMDADFEPGKETFFNTEYVLERVDNKTGKRNINSLDYDRAPVNATLYNEDLISIHGINQFYEVVSPKRGSISRKSREVLLDEEKLAALQSLVKKVREHSQSLFNIYGPEDTKSELATRDIDFDNALNTEVTVLLSPDKPLTDTLGGWLNNSETVNPFGASVTLQNGKKSGALSKFVYTNIIPDGGGGVPLSELIQDTFEDRVAAINGALFNHGTRLLGREVLKVMSTDFGNSDVSKHEGIVLRNEDLFGHSGPVKITGDFIVDGMVGAIGGLMKTKEPAIESPGAAPEFNIGLVPMSAKPYHAGHHMLVELAGISEVTRELQSIEVPINDAVGVFVSFSGRGTRFLKDREDPRTLKQGSRTIEVPKPGESPIFGADMRYIWNNILKPQLNLPPKVQIITPDDGASESPIKSVHDVCIALKEAVEAGAVQFKVPNLGINVNANSAIINIYSDDQDIVANYPDDFMVRQYGALWNSEQAPSIRGVGIPRASTVEISGTEMRKHLCDGNQEAFISMLPPLPAQAQVDIYQLLSNSVSCGASSAQTEEVPEEEPEGSAPPPIFMGESVYNFMLTTIKEQLNLIEGRDYQKESEVIASHDKPGGSLNTLLDLGLQDADAGGSPFGGEREKDRSKSAAPGYPGGGSAGHTAEAMSMAGGHVQGAAVDTEHKRDSLIREEDEELVEETMNYLLRALL